MKFCSKCGEVIPDDSVTCPKCGIVIKEQEEHAVIYASQEKNSAETVITNNKKKINKKTKIAIFVIIGIALLSVITFFSINEIGKASLKKQLLRDWMDIDDSLVKKVLDFSDDKVEYRLETVYSIYNSSLGTFEYKVISKDKIKIKLTDDKYITYTIKFNDDKSMMKVTPAITSTDPEEQWFNLDDYK
ncbi:zinc ribbon domain-containing protein [Lachnospira multipara]|uniref:zinc ribbon domain-containing protein n=1 Tax=Lachnospira multipara TaxID=28051 RepID=UPI0004E2396A|nr:zinc ribbon domain-containing protein [Lachnospira multipara]